MLRRHLEPVAYSSIPPGNASTFLTPQQTVHRAVAHGKHVAFLTCRAKLASQKLINF
jgi:hypothetical protein